ncbi:hypothetical protein SLE2022_144450 [Rubroshorea leprosula]
MEQRVKNDIKTKERKWEIVEGMEEEEGSIKRSANPYIDRKWSEVGPKKAKSYSMSSQPDVRWRQLSKPQPIWILTIIQTRAGLENCGANNGLK